MILFRHRREDDSIPENADYIGDDYFDDPAPEETDTDDTMPPCCEEHND